jgi:hypothetical protein
MWGRALALASVGAVLSLSCVRVERFGRGDIRELVLVEDRLEEEGRALERTFGRTFRVPQEESFFKVIHLKPDQFEEYRGYKNVIILASPTSGTLELFEEAFSEVDPGIYVGKNVFGDGDFVMGILAPKEELLRSFVESELPRIEEAILDRLNRFYERKVYYSGRDKKLAGEIREKYGFTLDIPEGWGVVLEEENFLSLAKHFPDRFMFVYREETPRSLDPDAIMDLRDELGRRYYDKDYVEREMTQVEETEFQGQEALRAIGVWQNEEAVMGGPFLFLAFNLENRFYMIDMAVYAPDKTRKLEYVLRQEIVARTFRLE